MALNWSIEHCRDWKEIAGGEDKPIAQKIEGAKTHRLVWACMSIDMSGITAKNVDEFWRRYEPIAKEEPIIWHFADASIPSETHYITRDDIVRRIGLSTNVCTLGKRAYDKKRKEIEAREARFRAERLAAQRSLENQG